MSAAWYIDTSTDYYFSYLDDKICNNASTKTTIIVVYLDATTVQHEADQIKQKTNTKWKYQSNTII